MVLRVILNLDASDPIFKEGKKTNIQEPQSNLVSRTLETRNVDVDALCCRIKIPAGAQKRELQGNPEVERMPVFLVPLTFRLSCGNNPSGSLDFQIKAAIAIENWTAHSLVG
jgi:hypothetical protein